MVRVLEGSSVLVVTFWYWGCCIGWARSFFGEGGCWLNSGCAFWCDFGLGCCFVVIWRCRVMRATRPFNGFHPRQLKRSGFGIFLGLNLYLDQLLALSRASRFSHPPRKG